MEPPQKRQMLDVLVTPPALPVVRTTGSLPVESLAQDTFSDLDTISLREVLESDSRPTFILDLDSDYVDLANRKDAIRPIFMNAALRSHDRLLDSITGALTEGTESDLNTTAYHNFHSWATGITKFDDSRDVFPSALNYRGLHWTGSTIRQRWRMISGHLITQVADVPKGNLFSSASEELVTAIDRNRSPRPTATQAGSSSLNSSMQPHPSSSKLTPTIRSKTTNPVSSAQISKERSSKASERTSNDTSTSSTSIALSSPKHVVPDWTVADPKGVLSDHLLFARSIDWAATPLGPMSSWSSAFREVANLVMRNPHPAALFWGEELTMFYNEAYKNEVAGNKHPELMGTGFSGPFSEIWDSVGPIMKECARTGHSVRIENDRLPIVRNGYLEECFFSWSLYVNSSYRKSNG
jgi:hypothetical protein